MSQSITSNAVAIATPDLEIIEGQITTPATRLPNTLASVTRT